MFYKDLELKKEVVRNFIKTNPKTTYKEIRKKLGIKIERLYSCGMNEAFEDAEVELPRNFKRRTKEEKKRIVIDYIKKHPTAGGHLIKKDTKISFLGIFKNTKTVFEEAGVKYPRTTDDRTAKEKKSEIINAVRKNPLITITELASRTKTKPYSFFRGMNDIYNKAKVKEIKNHEKRNIRKKQRIIEFLKKNPLATQREINKFCKTHVQELFKGGIFEAYEKAGIKFPYERLRLYGTTLKDIKNRAKKFEDEIAIKLSGYGKVNRLIRTKRGVADIIFERKDKKIVIEIKDYKAKEVSISQVKQLNKYLEDYGSNLGLLICHKKPKKDNFLIDRNKIFILEEEEIDRVPQIVDMGA